MTIVEFLTARLDEDEATTRRQSERWYVCDDGCVEVSREKWADGEDRLPNHHNTWDVMYDPERVRADIAAKRAIVDFMRSEDAAGSGLTDAEGIARSLRAIAVLRHLVYADHPDYQQEWSAV